LFAGLLPVSTLLVGAVVGTEAIDALELVGTVVVGVGLTYGLINTAGARARPM
jgi:thiol:disulfide interchange protein